MIAAWRWLTCEGLVPALVFAKPSGALGVLRFEPYYRGYDVRFRVAVASDGYRVVRDNGWEKMWGYRWVMDGIPEKGTVSYGAGCTTGAEGASVPLHDATALAECIWTAFDDEAGVRHVDLEATATIDRGVTGPPSPPPSRTQRWRRLYSTCGNSPALAFAVSAEPEVEFRDVAPAVLSVAPMASFAGFRTEP